MLVLARQIKEQVFITIGEEVIGRVKIIDIDRNKVVIGFDFDRDVTIHREEVYQQILDSRANHAQGRNQSSPVADSVKEDRQT